MNTKELLHLMTRPAVLVLQQVPRDHRCLWLTAVLLGVSVAQAAQLRPSTPRAGASSDTAETTRVAGEAPRFARSTVVSYQDGNAVREPRYFDGFIYPAPRVLQGPAVGAAGPRFELDAPIAIQTDPGAQYYAFGLSFRANAPGEPHLEWVTGAFYAPASSPQSAINRNRNQRSATPVTRISGPCGQDRQSQYQFMHEVALRNTGVRSWAAYDVATDRMLAAGRPVFWVTCEPGIANPAVSRASRLSMSTSQVRTYHVAVLLPARLVPDSAGGTLAIRMRDMVQTAAPARTTSSRTTSSRTTSKLPARPTAPRTAPGTRLPTTRNVTLTPPMVIALRPSPALIAVVGDSVAWGQGLPDGQKHSVLFAHHLGAPSRSFVFAHSGAKTGWFDSSQPKPHFLTQPAWDALNRPSISFAHAQLGSANDFCEKDRDFNGEVPRGHPTTQCQIAQSARLNCVISDEDSPGVQFRCESNEPLDPDDDRPGARHRRPHPDRVTAIDIRPRYDYVLLTSCLNDLGAENVLFDFGGLEKLLNGEHLQRLANRTARRCDLRNGLQDIRTFYPNAAIFVTSYHRFVSDETFKRFCGANDDEPSSAAIWTQARVIEGVFDATGPLLGLTGLDLEDKVSDLLGRLRVNLARLEQRRQNAISARVTTMIETELRVHRESADALNADRSFRGRGRIVPVALPWDEDESAFGPQARVFGLDCDIDEILGDRDKSLEDLLKQTEAEDSLRAPRHRACGTYITGRSDFPSTSQEEETCKRASAFHPNAAGASFIFSRIRGFATDAGLVPPRDAGIPSR